LRTEVLRHGFRHRQNTMTQISFTGLSDAQIVAGYVTFLASYLVFALGKFPGLKIDRPGAAIIGAVLMFAVRM
jgi:hypothetical protein